MYVCASAFVRCSSNKNARVAGLPHLAVASEKYRNKGKLYGLEPCTEKYLAALWLSSPVPSPFSCTLDQKHERGRRGNVKGRRRGRRVESWLSRSDGRSAAFVWLPPPPPLLPLAGRYPDRSKGEKNWRRRRRMYGRH